VSYDINVTDDTKLRKRLAIALPTVVVLAAGGAAFAWTTPDSGPARSVEAARVQLDTNPAAIFGTARNPFALDVSGAPTEGNSAQMVADLVPQVTNNWGGVAAFNATRYNASVNVASPDDPKVKVTFDDCQNKGATPAGLYDGHKMFLDVPMPANLRASEGTDKSVTIYQPSSDKLWEFWVTKNIDNAGRSGFSACWGGRIDDVSKSSGQHTEYFGSSASGLAQPGSMVTVAEAKAGKINHAIGLALMRTRAGTQWWPAVRNDGNTPGDNVIPEGARLRLKPGADLNGLTPLGKTIGEAAKKYGFLVVDTSGAVAVAGQDAPTADGKGSRWDTEVFGGVPDYQQLKGFPWDQLEVVQAGYGKDTPSDAPTGGAQPTPSTTAETPTSAPTTATPDPSTPAPSTPAPSTPAPESPSIPTSGPTTALPPTDEPTQLPQPQPTATADRPIAVGEPTPGVPTNPWPRKVRLDCTIATIASGRVELRCTTKSRGPGLVITMPTATPPVQPRT